MKNLFLLTAILVSAICAQAQTYYSRLAGSWSDNTSVWSTVSQNGAACSCSPGNSISGSTTVYIYNNVSSFGALASLAGSGRLVVESGDSAIITTSNLTLSGSSSIIINSGGILILNGALTMSGSSSITINGKMLVYGNVTNSGSAAVTDNGDLTVHGNVSTSGSAAFSGSGTSYVVGTVTGPNTSSLSVLPSYMSSFTSANGTGLVTYQTSPKINFVPLQYDNNSSDVLTGNGSWSSFSTLSPWQVSGSNLYYNAGNVGIGTASPNYPLTVQGNTLINGTLYASTLSASSGLNIGGFKIVNGVVDSFNSATGTILLNAATVNVLNGVTAQTITAPLITTTRIRSTPGDTAIFLGDSSFVFFLPPSVYAGNIFSSFHNGSTGLGGSNKFGANARLSEALGFNLTGNSQFAVSIGAGYTNNIDKSIMLGYTTPALTITGTNNYVGIGTTSPNYQFDVEPSSPSTVATMVVGAPSQTNTFALAVHADPTNPTVNAISVSDPNTGGIYFDVFADGTVHATEVKVCLSGTCDFVFDNNYKLMSLDTLSAYLKYNHHLPGIASAKEMEAEGTVSLGQMDRQLLQKVEELTLYTVQEDKEIKELKAQVKELLAKQK